MKNPTAFFISAFVLLTYYVSYGQDAQFKPSVYEKPLPEFIIVANQPSNFRFTTHMVNIKIPSSEADNWTVQLEKQYIETVFDFIEDKDFVIAQYSGFYYPTSSGLSGAHHINIQNTVEHIGLGLFSGAASYNSNDLLGITRLNEFQSLFPRVVNHELMHQWNSYLTSAFYWLVDPSYHTGLVEAETSAFSNNRDTFEHIQDTIYSYRSYFSPGFVGNLEGYLAGLWDAPSTLRTLKNYYHYPDLPIQVFDDYVLVQVKADEIDDVSQAELFNLYGGERVPNYQTSENDYDCVVIVFSLEDFLDDNYTKGFHYASVLNEIEDPDSLYNERYDEVFGILGIQEHPIYGKRGLNPYHASYKNLNFTTRLFEGTLGTDKYDITLNVKLYPNPTNQFLFIDVSSNDKFNSAQIYSLQGQLLSEEVNTRINVEKLSTGSYFLKVVTDHGTTIKRFLKL